MGLELMRLRDARCQVRGDKDSEWDLGSEEAGGDARGVFGAGHGDDQLGVGGGRRVVRERVDVDGVGGVTPGLHLLSNFVGVGRSEDTNSPDVFQGIRKIVEES